MQQPVTSQATAFDTAFVTTHSRAPIIGSIVSKHVRTDADINIDNYLIRVPSVFLLYFRLCDRLPYGCEMILHSVGT